ncbi:histidine kinase [Cupriavidus necator]|uniref:heavy metal sensor histidine kinase n=1 Tax=Cupriavidus TaxID=106589 RepID=UPI00032DECC8|nr:MULTISPECIES: heavy metal sensor histidine kinase [Cupriavidus]EON20235.1 signal transduction histidine kinase, heavy metal sensor [Cupriavidus sp. GA3-3]KUE87049.1 histidine kinase [Cupriavidus necator]
MNRQRSIAARLAAMFGLAAALVFTVTGMVLYRVQCVELEKRQLGEIRARFDLAGTKAAGLGTEKQWEHFAAMLRTLTPADHSVRYFVESTDPRFDYGEPFPREADTSPRAPDVWAVEFGDHRFLMLKRRIPALNDRPEVALAVAVDQAAFFETSRTLGIALVVSSVLGVIAVSLLGWRIAKSGLAPIERLSQHAGALDPKQLEHLPDADLPAELGGLVHAFNGALDKLEHAYQQLSAFNADVAHELRTPLGNVIGQTQVALSRPRSTEQLEEILQSNLEDLERLSRIVIDMLFVAQSDRGALARDLVEVSVAQEVRRSADFLDMLFEEAGATLHVTGDARVRVNVSLLQRALTNLMSNALQHGRPGRPVTVTIAQSADTLTIAVRNESDRLHTIRPERLFDRFYRADAARSDSRQNHGLGLAIVKAIATMHGGSVFAQVQADAIRIGMTLPVSEPAQAAPAPARPLPRPAAA